MSPRRSPLWTALKPTGVRDNFFGTKKNCQEAGSQARANRCGLPTLLGRLPLAPHG